MRFGRESNHALDEASIRTIVESLSKSWNGHDMRAFASVFSEDADFVNVGGIRWKGRHEIEARHAERHKVQFKESVLKINSIDVRFIESGVAIIHALSQISGDRDPNGTPRPSSRSTLFGAIAHKESGTWLLVAAQNTNVISQ
jgi:uncharacterized protein (TIGR02246 family)